MSLSVQTDRKLVRAAARSTRYTLVSFEAPVAPPKAGRRPVNVALVLDRSGSTEGEKIRLAREAIGQALRSLHPSDRFSLVVYDDRIDVLAPATEATGEAVRFALQRLADIDARGSTNLEGGWRAGCEQVLAVETRDDVVRRCLIATDGLANVGVTDAGQLAQFAADMQARGVATSTFGIGVDFDENLLRAMADAGRGHFYFIERAAHIPDCLTGELGEALEVVARDVTLNVELPAGVSAAPLNALPHRAAPGALQIALGDLVSGQDVEVVVKLRFPAALPGQTVAARFALSDTHGVLGGAWQPSVWMYASHQENNRQERNRVVDRAVARMYVARARSEALELNRAGEFRAARHVLEATRRRILAYAGDDPELRRLAAELEHDVEMLTAPISAMQRKVAFAASYNLLSMRDPSGKARRRPKP